MRRRTSASRYRNHGSRGLIRLAFSLWPQIVGKPPAPPGAPSAEIRTVGPVVRVGVQSPAPGRAAKVAVDGDRRKRGSHSAVVAFRDDPAPTKRVFTPAPFRQIFTLLRRHLKYGNAGPGAVSLEAREAAWAGSVSAHAQDCCSSNLGQAPRSARRGRPATSWN
jgi:hypothetical protein